MQQVESIIQTTMSQLKAIVDVNTIVGKPIYTEGNGVIVPVSKVSFGFFSGAGECPAKSKVQKTGVEMDNGDKFPFAGASIAGVSVTPKAFLSMKAGTATVLPVEYGCTLDRLVEMIPPVIEEVKRTVKAAREQNKDCSCKDEQKAE